NAGLFFEGRSSMELNGKWFEIDKTGKEVGKTNEPDQDTLKQTLPLLYPFKNPETGKWGFKDSTGNIIIQPGYDYAHEFSEGLADVRKGDVINGKWGFINSKNETVIPLTYSYVGSFSQGKAAVRLNGKMGYINPDGEVVIPLEYDFANNFKNGKAEVKQGDRFFYIDETGTEIKK